jgi:hypothetical protein
MRFRIVTSQSQAPGQLAREGFKSAKLSRALYQVRPKLDAARNAFTPTTKKEEKDINDR